MNRPADQSDRPSFPAIVEDIGEDPARFLYTDGLGESRRQLILARIRGIDRIQVCNAWLAVEPNLHGGREAVVEAIEQRRDYLEEHGERERLSAAQARERLQQLERVRPPEDDQPDPVWRHEACGSTDVEKESSRAWFCNECEQRTNRVERVDAGGQAAVATDGGEAE